MSDIKHSSPVLNLDEPAYRQATLILRFEGKPILLSHERLHELLRREKELIDLLTAGPSAALPPQLQTEADSIPAATRPYVPPPQGAGTLSHATLSYRVKRIHDYGARQRRLRETHVAILHDLLSSFDGRLPDHPSPALEVNLTALLRWRSVPQDLKDAIQRFLAGYLEAKAHRRA